MLCHRHINDLPSFQRSQFPELDEFNQLTVLIGRQPGQHIDPPQDFLAMVGTLLRIEIQDSSFALGKVSLIIENLITRNGRRDYGADIERLLGFSLSGGCAEVPQSADSGAGDCQNDRLSLVFVLYANQECFPKAMEILNIIFCFHDCYELLLFLTQSLIAWRSKKYLRTFRK